MITMNKVFAIIILMVMYAIPDCVRAAEPTQDTNYHSFEFDAHNCATLAGIYADHYDQITFGQLDNLRLCVDAVDDMMQADAERKQHLNAIDKLWSPVTSATKSN